MPRICHVCRTGWSMWSMLTLGQMRDVCLQIRAWREQGELERAVFWSRRLRGERPMCSVDGCLAAPLPDRPWCRAHRPRFLADEAEQGRKWMPAEKRIAAIRAVLAEAPTITDDELARRVGLCPWMVRMYRRKAGIPNVWHRRWEARVSRMRRKA